MWGLGKIKGRNAPTIFAPACGTDADDPYLANAAETQQDSAVQIGSISKSVTFATLRWAVKEQLGLWDTDIDLTVLSSSRLISAQRLSNGKLRLFAWNVNSGGVVARQGTQTPMIPSATSLS